MKILHRLVLFIFIFIFISVSLKAQKTEIKLLSGTGYDNTVDWQFYCTEGMNSGIWTTIPVPSNWELMGFGTYNYGLAKNSVRAKEKGLYKYEFQVPGEWKDKVVNIVFEGVMTDAEVRINGILAGPVHQGAFYRFAYDISELLNFKKPNLLEVTVLKHSANESVNKAERYADYWIFGGIFRPVYLEAKPLQHIGRVAIDARADGTFTADVFLSNSIAAGELRAQIYTLENQQIGEQFSVKVSKGSKKISIQSKLDNIESWNPEHPKRYKVKFELYSGGQVLHETDTRFGFRTIEVRDREGIYVNGVKVKFKGVNRHTFRPEHGRTSCKMMSIEDVMLIKSMNMNAVRMSHYPPDTHFLEACDSLGLFVVNELAGWHNAYDTQTGTKLLEEMVIRDVNHPSIVLWCNGNEGGHNPEFDTLFEKFDIQHRRVIHPWIGFNGISTEHYRSYDYGAGTYWHGHDIVLPTEFLHGLYDGGSGAGLDDYWELIWNTPNAAGGFLWVFADEGVVRTDKNGEIDTDGDHGPDGIIGPNHEKEGSFFAVKKIWSPIKVEEKDITDKFDGRLHVENRYLYTNSKECSFSWRLAGMPFPEDDSPQKVMYGEAISPDIIPGQKGILQLNLPSDWFSYDVLYLTATDPYNKELYTWSFPISLPDKVVTELSGRSKIGSAISFTENDSLLLVAAGKIQYSIGKQDGKLKKVSNEKGEIPFRDGPDLSAGVTIFESLRTEMYGDSLQIICTFDEDASRMKEFTWTFYPSGWAKLHLYYVPEFYDKDFDYMGVNFSYPEELILGVKWLGRGPYRVWKNRMQGIELGIHQKDYNNTITGVPPLIYPEFKGYHANLYWAVIKSREQSFIVATSTEDVFLRLYTPALPEKVSERLAPAFPSGDISFMQAIPAIGSKTNDAWNLGPSGKKNMFYDFGPYDNWRLRSKQMTLYFDFSGNK